MNTFKVGDKVEKWITVGFDDKRKCDKVELIGGVVTDVVVSNATVEVKWEQKYGTRWENSENLRLRDWPTPEEENTSTEVPELTDTIRAAQKALVGVCLLRLSIDSVFFDLKRFTDMRVVKYLTFEWLSKGQITRHQLRQLGLTLNDLSEEWHGWPAGEMEIFGEVVYAERLIWKFLDDTQYKDKRKSVDSDTYTFPKYPMIDATET